MHVCNCSSSTCIRIVSSRPDCRYVIDIIKMLVIPWCACAARDTVIVQAFLLVSVCTSHSSLVSCYITQYFAQLGFERHGSDANKNGFS